MNERIKELIEQSGFEEKDGHISIQGVYMFNTYRMEKFAELIVRECITKVEMRKKFATEDQHIVDHAFDLLVYDLESHFGVEE